mmetsp:Transcript_22368/g.38397  ORF Transcript_22368/g.38397 Transcript_22368/m.38397 type:complete len:472 (+) Transcript_22368:101-1516(+)|eukprot:CAMPEP_0196658404 /NCGR_PEP_ID=MMETSP1086-20130531/29556_1 /TAXON_ID=77921 /ORGANISM="Cyanoptyche  gloeocystis , Strain SAG4.97" /LENGTH=471 /DNA_ID=CAMNT_0041991965 /DNA_START=85 /DNA_END=1500 /DNA_ORIENTATION=+
MEPAVVGRYAKFHDEVSESPAETDPQQELQEKSKNKNIGSHMITIDTTGPKVSALSPPATAPKVRRMEYDWIRTLLLFEVFFQHSNCIFVTSVFCVSFGGKAQYEIFGLAYFDYYMGMWPMELMFLVAGCSSWYSLKSRSPFLYVKERLLRLGVPLLFGLFVLNPITVYFRLLWAEENIFSSFWAYYLQYFTHYDSCFIGTDNGFMIGHLWFILYLVGYSIISLPFFIWVRKQSSSWISKPWVTFGIAPAVMGLAACADHCPKNSLYFFCYFVYGYLIVQFADIQTLVNKYAWTLFVGGLMLRFPVTQFRIDLFANGEVYEIVYWLMGGYVACLTALGALGLGRRYLTTTNNKFIQWASDMGYPCYVIHYLYITIWAYLITQVWSDFGFQNMYAVWIINLSLLLTSLFLTYEFILKPIKPLRFLVGMHLHDPAKPSDKKPIEAVKPKPLPEDEKKQQPEGKAVESLKIIPS